MPVSESLVDKSEQRVREMFRQVAPRYDLMNHLLSMNIDRYWRWRAVRAMRLIDDSPILDVCTGTGDLALAIAARVGPKIRVVGSDFCSAMLRIGQRKRSTGEDNLRGRVDFLEADSQQLPFPDDRFQAVTVAFGLRNVSDTDRGLREMTRVCKPGGQVMVLEFSNPSLPGFRQVYQWYFENVLPKIGQALAKNDKDAYRYLQKSVGQFPDGPRLVARMVGAGLVGVSYRTLTGGVASIYTGFKPGGEHK
jgi:demethylmenaquinone methyltransferase/2-methoxy-6-polyprenyl-1,4-benzoquinol methylase